MMRIQLRIGESHFVLEESAADTYVMRIRHSGEPEAVFEVSSSVASPIVELAVRARVSAAPSTYALGVGGRSKQLTLDMGLNAATFRWWQSVPAGWEELEDIAATIERASLELMPRYILGGE